MKTIFKYKIKPDGIQKIEMPDNAEFLTVQTQNDCPCLWVRVDPDTPKRTYGIAVYGTGKSIPADCPMEYIDSFQLFGGALVFHVFELT